jgi:hypothetical protein
MHCSKSLFHDGTLIEYINTQTDRFRVHACPGATGYGYATIFIFYRYGLSPPHLDMPGLGQGFKGYNCLKLFTILIKICNTGHHPLGEKAI